VASDPTRSTSSASGAPLGATEPRLWTPPLVDLTPETSYGFELIDFARDVLGTPFDAWQEWLSVHAGELLPDGRPRFRTVLVLVARQNGKSLWLRTLILWWLFVEQVPLVLGTSTDRSYAKASWRQAIEIAQGNEWLSGDLGPGAVRLTLGEETFRTLVGSEYQFAATNRRAGRSLTVHRLALDELREHASWDAWNAATNALSAVHDGQTIATTNQGDDTSVVLDALRAPALEYAQTGRGDPRLGIFEWSAPDGADPTDLDALAMANPNLGRRLDVDNLLGAAARAKAAGGEELTGYRTEAMCQRVHQLDPAIDLAAWQAHATDAPLDLAPHRKTTALCLDVSLDGQHATLVAAARVDGKIHVECVEAWSGPAATRDLRAALPGLVAKIRPRTIGWFPQGPAAAVAADVTEARQGRGWTPRGTEVREVGGDAAAACMGLADVISAGGELVQPGDPVLDAHLRATTRLWRGDRWVFQRRGGGPIDGAYALAGAVHLARTLPPAPPPLVAL
jgi:hypothetical protein